MTEDWKFQLRPFFNYNYDYFERNDREITSTSRRDGFTSYVVRSISPHWSVGAFGDVLTSTFDNLDLRLRLMPAVEYSMYPYREATRRQLTIAYSIGGSHITYRDATIHEETQQLLIGRNRRALAHLHLRDGHQPCGAARGAASLWT